MAAVPVAAPRPAARVDRRSPKTVKGDWQAGKSINDQNHRPTGPRDSSVLDSTEQRPKFPPTLPVLRQQGSHLSGIRPMLPVCAPASLKPGGCVGSGTQPAGHPAAPTTTQRRTLTAPRPSTSAVQYGTVHVGPSAYTGTWSVPASQYGYECEPAGRAVTGLILFVPSEDRYIRRACPRPFACRNPAGGLGGSEAASRSSVDRRSGTQVTSAMRGRVDGREGHRPAPPSRRRRQRAMLLGWRQIIGGDTWPRRRA